ncbi:MAG TPA: hypothetical protein VK590_15345, partial [Saprospiraceae bacterium]|nr:hypothetical protein [Saprospiraceae bacterium]
MKIRIHIIILLVLNSCICLSLIAQDKMDKYVTLGATDVNNLTLELQSIASIIHHDICEDPYELKVNAECKGNSFIFEKPKESNPGNQKRFDIWYSFIAPASGHVSVILSAELAESLEVYSGRCSNLTAISSVANGQQTEVKSLIPGNKYLLKINGVLTAIYENCITIKEVVPVLPAYQNCLNAKVVTIGDICTPGNNQYNKFSGPKPSCVPYAEANVWYAIRAPESGSIKLNSGADFYHVLAVYSGKCDSLVEIFCSKNPQKCNGYLEVRNLYPGQQYYVQIASAQGPFGYNFGNF